MALCKCLVQGELCNALSGVVRSHLSSVASVPVSASVTWHLLNLNITELFSTDCSVQIISHKPEGYRYRWVMDRVHDITIIINRIVLSELNQAWSWIEVGYVWFFTMGRQCWSLSHRTNWCYCVPCASYYDLQPPTPSLGWFKRVERFCDALWLEKHSLASNKYASHQPPTSIQK